MRENMALLRWLETAVSGIRFGPDRKAARAELYAHIEDKALGLARLFPDMTEDETRDLALAAMGDPEELRIELAKIHRPWLGWLWTASRWALVALVIVFLFVGFNRRVDFASNSLWGRMSGQAMYHRVYGGEKARLGGYTFRIIGAAWVDRPEEEGAADSLQLTLRVSSLRFWAQIDENTVLAGLTAAGPDGVWYSMAEQTRAERLDVGHDSPYWISTIWSTSLWTGGDFCRWGPGWKDFSLYVPAEGWTPGERMTLKFTCELGDFTLSAPVTERVVVL